jgi:hypothetical protein
MGGFLGIGATGGAASAAANGALEAVQKLRAAAAQQQQLQQVQAQKQFGDELELRKAGYTPYMQTTGQDSSGLKRREAQPGADPNSIVTDPYGQKWVKAPPTMTPGQQGTQAHEQSDDLMRALGQGGQPVSPQGTVFQNGDIPRMSMPATGPADSSNLVNTGGSGVNVAPPHPELVQPIGGKQVYMPSEGEKAETELRKKVAETEGTHAAIQDAEGWVLPDSMAAAAEQHAGLPPGSLRGVKLPHEAVADAFKRAITPEKAEKPDATAIIPGMTGPGGGLVVFDKNKQTTAEVPVPKGSKREATPAQAEAKQRADERLQQVYQGRHDKLQTEEQAQWDLRAKHAAVVDSLNDGATVTVKDEQGKAVMVTPKNRDSLKKYYTYAAKKAEERALDAQGKARGIRQKLGWGEFGAGQEQQTAGGQPAAPPADVLSKLSPGEHTFKNGQTWRKTADGTVSYVGGGQ